MTQTEKRELTPLELALLGLAAIEPQSGYALRKTFEDTPMRAYSSSPGSTYPALKRLGAAGLMKRAPDPKSGHKTKLVFHVTPNGVDAVKQTLRRPISIDDIRTDLRTLMLRFAFADRFLSPRQMRKSVRDFRGKLAAYIDELEAHMKTERKKLSKHGALILKSGIDTCKVHLKWADSALALLDKAIDGV
ncbi:MAG: PadR family transcriptional regulator [Parvularculaceae bacterium]